MALLLAAAVGDVLSTGLHLCNAGYSCVRVLAQLMEADVFVAGNCRQTWQEQLTAGTAGSL
jgi:hypothetical protein